VFLTAADIIAVEITPKKESPFSAPLQAGAKNGL